MCTVTIKLTGSKCVPNPITLILPVIVPIPFLGTSQPVTTKASSWYWASSSQGSHHCIWGKDLYPILFLPSSSGLALSVGTETHSSSKYYIAHIKQYVSVYIYRSWGRVHTYRLYTRCVVPLPLFLHMTLYPSGKKWLVLRRERAR